MTLKSRQGRQISSFTTTCGETFKYFHAMMHWREAMSEESKRLQGRVDKIAPPPPNSFLLLQLLSGVADDSV